MTVDCLIDFLALLFLYLFCCFRRWKAQGGETLLVNTALYVYLSFVLYFTLMPIISALPSIFDHPYEMYLIPFDDLINGRGDAVRQVVLNVIMTIPFGFLFPLTQKRKQGLFLRTLLCVFLLSLCIELVQPLLHGARSCDVTDVITNTAGGTIGFSFFVLFQPITEAALRRIR